MSRLLIPSGQQTRRASDLVDLEPYGHRMDTSTPLWFYVLREAQIINDGQFLGPVGGRIVAEVMLGLLRADPTSYLQVAPAWRPNLGARGGDYQISDFLRFAQVDPDSRQQ